MRLNAIIAASGGTGDGGGSSGCISVGSFEGIFVKFGPKNTLVVHSIRKTE